MSFQLASKTHSDVADLMSWGSLFQTDNVHVKSVRSSGQGQCHRSKQTRTCLPWHFSITVVPRPVGLQRTEAKSVRVSCLRVIGSIGGFNQRQGEALPTQIFLTSNFVVWAIQNDEIVETRRQIRLSPPMIGRHSSYITIQRDSHGQYELWGRSRLRSV